jgi:hypothetical protein
VRRRARTDQPGPRSRQLARLTVTLAVLALVAAAVTTLARSAPRRSGTNYAADTGLVVVLASGEQLCQPGELVPADTGAVRLRASRDDPRRLEATITTAQGLLARGVTQTSSHSGALRIDFRDVSTTTSATVCLRNLGKRSVLLGGSLGDSPFTMIVGGRPVAGRVRIEYMRPGRESWAELLPTVIYRMSLGKSDLIRHWAAAGALVLMLLAVWLTIRTLLREQLER